MPVSLEKLRLPPTPQFAEHFLVKPSRVPSSGDHRGSHGVAPRIGIRGGAGTERARSGHGAGAERATS